MKRLIIILPVLLLLSGCVFSTATVAYKYELRKDKKWYQSKWEKEPLYAVDGSPGKLKVEDSDGLKLDVERTKGAALIDLGGVVRSGTVTND